MSQPPASPIPDALRVGHVPGVTLTKWRTRWVERLSARLDVVEVAETDQWRVLQAGEVDVCFVRQPAPAPGERRLARPVGMHEIAGLEEVAVAWVSKEHPVAAFDEVSLADLADETVLTEVDAVSIDRVNAGAVLLVPLAVARSASRRDLVHRPVSDAPATTVALAWRADNEHPLIEEFVGIVRGRTANSARTQAERARTPRRRPGR